MFFSRSKPAQPALGVTVLARLNDRAQPMDRGALYEDPLDALLRERQWGEVTGGGTQLSEEGEIQFCDIELLIRGPVDETVELVRSSLEGLGAPRGSKLLLEGPSREIPLGLNEGLAVYLNGTDLPERVYQECDANFVYNEFNRLLGEAGQIHSFWEGPESTALYAYGPSFAAMQTRLAEFLSSYPLCQRALVVQIA